MPSFCVVSNCEYKYTHAENVSFHKFPYHSPEIVAKWIKFTDRGPDWKPSRWSAICSRHFLPSDFRNLLSRKCLKKDAVPSITIKQFTGNFLELQGNHQSVKTDFKLTESSFQMTSDDQSESNCRLCGVFSKGADTFATNFEVFGMIQKCFPTLNIQQDDELPKNICSACLERLHLFSDFIDEVLKTQQSLETKFNNEDNHSEASQIGRSLKIKQEPVVKVKQEINETVQSSNSDDYETELNDEQSECDQKSQLQNNLQIINSEEIINNCDIIEIITLDDAFIDIPDDEIGEEESTPAEAQIIQQFVNPGEHSYAKSMLAENETLDQTYYKTELSEEQEASVPVSLQPNIVVIDESIVKSNPDISCVHCDICATVFLNESTLTEHKNLYHTSTSRNCIPCNQRFDSFYKFLKHKNKFHKTRRKELVKKKTNLNCSMCDKVFTSKLALNNHSKYICDFQHIQEYECKHCGKKMNKWTLLRRHEKSCRSGRDDVAETENQDHQLLLSSATPTLLALTSNNISTNGSSQPKSNDKGQFVCPICGRTYSRRHNLFKHQITHRPPSLWNYKCGDCNKLFDHIYDLRRHLKTKACSKNNQIPTTDEDYKPIQPLQTSQPLFFICTICGKQLKTLQRLKQHSISHSGKKPYVCESCGKSFANVNNLYQHRITHSDVRRYKCDLCEKVFKRRGGLNQHRRAYHLKIKPHECPTCKHRYALKGDMKRCKHSLLRQ